MKESDLFEPLKHFLLDKMKCDAVYAEVGSIDVVGQHGNYYIGIEMKTSLNFKVIAQAQERQRYVDYVFILVPLPKKQHERIVLEWIKELGIGLMYYGLNKHYSYESEVRIVHWGKRNKVPYKDTTKRIIEKEKHLVSINVGGVKGGESITPYKNTIDKIKHCLYFEKNGLTIKEILERVETHYANPKPSTAATLRAHWNVAWCEYVERADGAMVYRMKEEYREPYWKEYRELSSEIRELRRLNR